MTPQEKKKLIDIQKQRAFERALKRRVEREDGTVATYFNRFNGAIIRRV